MSSDRQPFLDFVAPYLKAGDPGRLAAAVREHYDLCDLCGLLQHRQDDCRRVAAMVLGLIGDHRHVNCLTAALHDRDDQVNQMAEYALWSIWFRSCHTAAAGAFRRGVELLEAERYREAIAHFTHAAELDPAFAECHNQCGIAHYFLGQYDKSIHCCERALELNPVHFGAIGGMGHSYLQLGNLEMALVCYRHVLDINPRAHDIRKAAERMEAKLASRLDETGEFTINFANG